MNCPPLEWTTLEDSTRLPGLRLAVVRAGVPSPWSEFCRALFDSRGIPYAPVDARDPSTGYARLKQLTSQESLPVAFWNDERPRAMWYDIVALAERLANERRDRPEGASVGSLVPEDIQARVQAFGVCDELLGEGGFCWNRRLMFCEKFKRRDASEREQRVGAYLGKKYAVPGRSVEEAQARCERTVSYVASLLRAQQDRGSQFMVGNALSVADFAWAVRAALIQPLSHEDCPMQPMFRDAFTWTPAQNPAEDIARVLAHRDRTYAQYMRIPVVVG